MSWSKWIRQGHRWLSIVFTALVVANIIVNVTGTEHEALVLWVGLATLLPLALLLFTGLYLFVLPYMAKWRGRRTGGEGSSR